MASTSTPHPGVIDEINALFSWNPPLLSYPEENPSSATRPPGFYDKHFSERLVLKRVKPLPSLVPDLARNVQKALDSAIPTLPPLSFDFITAAQRKSELKRYARVLKDENEVANVYDKYAANYCLPVASTLALHPTASFSEWSSLLRWTQSVSSTGCAIIQRGLHFERDAGFEADIISHRATIVKTMEDDVLRIFTEMRDSGLPLATWNLTASSGEVMSAVPDLGTFSWTFCNDLNCRKISGHRRALKGVTHVVVGPDAKDPPWSLPEAGDPPLSLVPNHGSMSSLSSLSSSFTDGGTRNRGMKRKRDDGFPPKDNARKQKTDVDANENNDNNNEDEDNDIDISEDEESRQDQHELAARSLLQQAWAEATRVGGTLIVLHSGNYELVCVRHRASQTLYVSAVIEPHACANPAYGELQVGIYVAAIQDAIDRKQQPQPPVLSRGSKGDNNDEGPTKHDSLTGGELAIKNTIHEASNRDMVRVYLRYGVYDSAIPASFLRSAPSITTRTKCSTSPQTIYRCGPGECLTIVLTSEIGRGATGVVHRGTLMPEIWHNAIPLDVVVKFSFDLEQRKALRNEYEVYRHLKLKEVNQGVTTTLGFFDDAEDGACALVMLYAGLPLSPDLQSSLSISDCKSALSVLDSIHGAGILHGDISPRNILIGDSGITIIDFAHSKKCGSKRAKDEELIQLCDLLGLAGESHY